MMVSGAAVSVGASRSFAVAGTGASVNGRAGLCFSRLRNDSGVALEALSTQDLPAKVAQALADTLPFLLCGEESAVHAFGRRFAGRTGRQAALKEIVEDELHHAAWLEALAARLPAPSSAPDAGRMAGFFRNLLTRDPARHFAQIAALDLAVCDLMRPMVAPDSVLAGAPALVAGLRAIRKDEARHVRVARDCARELGFDIAQQRALANALQIALGELLATVRGSLECLGFQAFGAFDSAHV
jgi:rubrerythrin